MPRRGLVLAALGTISALTVWVSCHFGISPDQGRFSCSRDSDCGSGQECAPRSNSTGGVCFPLGYCASFDFSRDNQHCGDCATACPDGTRCVSSECHEWNCGDGVDNDGNGLTDCEDPYCAGRSCSMSDAGLNCGTLSPDAGEVDGGSSDGGRDSGQQWTGAAVLRSCVPRETICDDGVDNDGDGATDCEDDDCEGRACAPGKICRNFSCQ
jgi:hypothetical protein